MSVHFIYEGSSRRKARRAVQFVLHCDRKIANLHLDTAKARGNHVARHEYLDYPRVGIGHFVSFGQDQWVVGSVVL